MKPLKKLIIMVFTAFFVSAFSGCEVYSYVTPGVQTNYENPQWAPPYYAGVRYYYIPDIEAYYDLSSREFVYLSAGQWCYSTTCPSGYEGFDLNNCFTIALDINTYQPWMHHQYYVSHYPRYYYRDYYDHSNIAYVRGFNENSKHAVYWSENERSRARSWDGEGLKTNHQFKYNRDDRPRQANRNTTRISTRPSVNDAEKNQGQRTPNTPIPTRPSVSDNVNRQPQRTETEKAIPTRSVSTENVSRQQPVNKTETVRTTQNTNYYGRNIGQPVKVEKQMRMQTKTAVSNGKTGKANGNRTDQKNQERR